MSTARLIVAAIVMYMAGGAVAQSPSPAGRIFQDPPSATTGEAKSGAAATMPGTDPSAKKTFNESRSNALRTAGDAKTAVPATDPSAKKTFNESRSNALRTPGDAKAVANGVDPSGRKSDYESRSNTANRATADAKATVPETSLPMNAAPAPSAPR